MFGIMFWVLFCVGFGSNRLSVVMCLDVGDGFRCYWICCCSCWLDLFLFLLLDLLLSVVLCSGVTGFVVVVDLLFLNLIDNELSFL